METHSSIHIIPIFIDLVQSLEKVSYPVGDTSHLGDGSTQIHQGTQTRNQHNAHESILKKQIGTKKSDGEKVEKIEKGYNYEEHITLLMIADSSALSLSS